MMRRTRRVARGVTLIELIVGMGIISILFVGLGYIFQQAVAAHSIATGQAEIHQQVRAVFDYLGRELNGIPRDGRLVVASPAGAADPTGPFAPLGVTVYSDVLCFTTATPLPVRKSVPDLLTDPPDDLIYNNLAGVCYFRWRPSSDAKPVQQALYRVMDRLDTGETISDLGVGSIPAPSANPTARDQLAIRVVTPLAGAPSSYGAFEVEYGVYNKVTRELEFFAVEDGGTEVYDSATTGLLPRAIRVKLRCWDRSKHVRDEDSGERGIEFQETFAIPAGE